MTTIGYALSSEEHRPDDLVLHAHQAEQAGFDFLMVSDHFHPWTSRQGQSPFVWSVLGALAVATDRVPIGTGVTCPLIRMHPAIVAHAAATTASLMPGRFFLGVGTGENLNEHVLGDAWPSPDVRLEMLEEAVDVIRKLWGGEQVSHHGTYYTVEDARLYTLPATPPPIVVAAKAPRAAELAGRIGDGLCSTAPERSLVARFADSGGAAKPRYGQLTVCYANSEDEARRTAHEWWPNAGVTGDLSQELPLPRHFEQAAEMVSEDDVARRVVCGPDPDRHLQAIADFVDAGFDHVYVHQVGPEQRAFLDFYADHVLAHVR